MAKKPVVTRAFPEGRVPLVSCEGTAYEAGIQLGYSWAEALRLKSQEWDFGTRSWWMEKRFAPLIERYAPHLPDLYRGMAKGARVPEERIGHPAAMDDVTGCTSFAIQPKATLDGIPVSGQTKDTPASRWFQFQVLRLKLTDAPSTLTLTYQGWPFGHGFVAGRCSIFRNSLYVAAPTKGELPYSVWGLLAIHCKTVDDAVELIRTHPTYRAFHCTVADEQGGIVGIEMGKGGPGFLKPKRGIYTHANAVSGLKRMLKHEGGYVVGGRENSYTRERSLRKNLEADNGHLTPQLAMMALTDHTGHPGGVCRHESHAALTCAAVVAEPTRGLLHVTRGNPCQNWPHTYAL